MSAKPQVFQGVIPYEEIVLHPAFGKEVKNAGSFVLTKDNKLLRRQISPQAEEMEIGSEKIIIRRHGKQVTRKIPRRMKPFFALLQAAILGQPHSGQGSLQHKMHITPTGWRAEILFQPRDKSKITFSGCGTLLKSIGLKLSGGQERVIRFKTQ